MIAIQTQILRTDRVQNNQEYIGEPSDGKCVSILPQATTRNMPHVCTTPAASAANR